MTVSHFRITQASLISALTFIVGQLAAFIPQFGPDKQNLISAGTAVISAAFLIANALHALTASKVSAKDLEGDVGTLVKSEIGRVDFNAVVHQAVSANGVSGLEDAVRKQVQAELGRIFGQQSPPAASGAPVAPPAAPAQ